MENKIILIDHGDGPTILEKLKASGMDTTNVILVKPEDVSKVLPENFATPTPIVRDISIIPSLHQQDDYIYPKSGKERRRERRKQERKSG